MANFGKAERYERISEVGCTPFFEKRRQPQIRGWPGSDHDTYAATYRCFLPDLTRFMGVCYAATGQSESRFSGSIPRKGIQPRISGFRVQGTAGSPPSTTCVTIAKKRILSRKKHYFFFNRSRHVHACLFIGSITLLTSRAISEV